eukprot:15089971-Alexandrium_andersonii.AAC.1
MGAADDGMTLQGVLAKVFGQATYPERTMLARTSEEDFKQAISDLGDYVDISGDSPELARIGLVDKGRL